MTIMYKTIITATALALSLSASSAWAAACPASAKATLTLRTELAPKQNHGVNLGTQDRYIVTGALDNSILVQRLGSSSYQRMTSINSGQRIAAPTQYKNAVKLMVGRAVDNMEIHIKGVVGRICPNTKITFVNRTGY